METVLYMEQCFLGVFLGLWLVRVGFCLNFSVGSLSIFRGKEDWAELTKYYVCISYRAIKPKGPSK